MYGGVCSMLLLESRPSRLLGLRLKVAHRLVDCL